MVGVFQAPQHIGRPSGGSDSDDDVLLGQTDGLKIRFSQVIVVLRALNRLHKGPLASGDEPNHHIRRNAKGGRALHRIQHTQPSAGARAHVDDPSSGADGFRSPGNTLGNVGKLRPDGIRHLGILLIHGGYNFQCRHTVQIHRPGISGFRQQVIQCQSHVYSASFAAELPFHHWPPCRIDPIIRHTLQDVNIELQI